MQTSHFFNPEDASREIMTKSFLKSRETMRETGSKFFSDNKIRSCSFVKEGKQGNCKAIPFYDRRNNTVYPTKSDITRSWTANTHGQPTPLKAGMGSTKPLTTYDTMHQRNLLNIPDFIPNHPNNSRNIAIGNRHGKDVKHYLSNYGNSNSFVHESRRLPSNHPGIQAFRNKWIKSRLEK